MTKTYKLSKPGFAKDLECVPRTAWVYIYSSRNAKTRGLYFYTRKSSKLGCSVQGDQMATCTFSSLHNFILHCVLCKAVTSWCIGLTFWQRVTRQPQNRSQHNVSLNHFNLRSEQKWKHCALHFIVHTFPNSLFYNVGPSITLLYIYCRHVFIFGEKTAEVLLL